LRADDGTRKLRTVGAGQKSGYEKW